MNRPQDQASYPAGTSSNAQAEFVTVAKSPATEKDGKPATGFQTRNWSLFFFFRIMRRVEMNATKDRLIEAIETFTAPSGGSGYDSADFLSNKTESPLNRLKLDLAYPNVLNGGMVAAARFDADESAPARDSRAANDGPAQAFLDWLKVLVEADAKSIRIGADSLAAVLAEAVSAMPAGPDASGGPLEPAQVEQMLRDLATSLGKGKFGTSLPLARHMGQVLDHIKADYRGVMTRIRESIDAPPDDSAHGPLARMVLYEFLRQGAPIFLDGEVKPVLRSEASEAKRLEGTDDFDQTPITMTFSFPGLRALKVHPNTLSSFPDAFKEGMAARALRLGDIGPSAPENWDGELGLRTVHGYFTGGSNLERKEALSERFWKELRSEIRLFNDPTIERGTNLRAWIGLLFRLVGLEIVHIELGQDPYRVAAGEIEHIRPRVEHFGFRDGLSQPFVDLRLGDTLAGGGTASRRGTWTPVAPGEIFLDREDETGQEHMVPLHADLRKGSTYLVFRKLEQDVEGFRAFLEQQRPNEPRAQDKLAAQFYGRWPNGTSLVHSPHTERSTAGAENEAGLNDFRYGADDPLGRKCPLGAHVRRANPRDIGGRNDVRHHRILRRGIAYGGPLLSKGQADDGEKRGILFICANASIDLQFEVVQGDWINGGEFLGQAGLGRCPISGANDGGTTARFLEAGAVAPVTGVPGFVRMRGGDYFFAPGITALKRIAEGFDFKVETSEVPFRGHSMNEVATPSLFTEDRLNRYWKESLGGGDPVRVKPRAAAGPGVPQETVAFVGRYDQVKEVLSNKTTPDEKSVYFSVEPYCTAGRRISRGEDFLIGTDAAGSPSRARLMAVLEEGWKTLARHMAPPDPIVAVRAAARARLDAAVRCAAGARRIDLVEDLAAQAAYAVIDKVFGIRGPRWLTELAAAIPFARQHIGDLPRDWIMAFKGEMPADPGLKTMQVWSTFLVADLIGNALNQQPLHVLARQAGSEMLNHIDQSLAEAAARGPVTQPRNLIEAFLFNAQMLGLEARKQPPPEPPHEFFKHYAEFGKDWLDVYRKDVAIILLEILGSTLAVIPLTFANVMTTLLNFRIDLSLLLPRLEDSGVAQIVYEAERLKPNAAIRVRRCAVAPPAGGLPISQGDFVAAVIAAANMDRHVFWEPDRFSLGRFDPLSDNLKENGEPPRKDSRDPDNYLLFGVENSNKICWGRRLVAMPILQECLYACGRLQGLRKVAGPRGEPQKLGEVTIGLPARFTRILSKDVREE